MTLTRTLTQFSIIDAQVKALEMDTFLQNCLAQYLAVAFYSEMEEQISSIISNRLQEFTTSPIGLFLTSNMENIIRRTAKSDLVALLSNFGPEFKTSFNELVSETDVSFYSNVITARHSVGHKQGSNVTLADIERGLFAAQNILMALHKCFDAAKSIQSPEAQKHTGVGIAEAASMAASESVDLHSS